MNRSGSHIVTLFIVLGLIAWFAPGLNAQFHIGPGGWVTVKSGASMMIGMDVHIKSIDGASGYLVDQNVNGDITITGDVTVERYLSPDVWHNVSSPVSNENTGVYAGTDLVFWYNEALILNDWNFGWVWYTGATGGPLMAFRGYDVYYYTNPFTVNYQATGSEVLNTGPYSITVINTASTPSEIPSHKGWNLLGNPYPSPVDWLAPSGWNKGAINDAKYIWDGANDIYTIFVGGGSPIGINGGTRFIPSNQGFWVQSVVASGTVGINNAVRVGEISGTPDYYKDAPIDYAMVSLVAGGFGRNDEAVVRFIPGTTPGFDLNYDATKLYSLNPDVPQISIRSGKQTFALNTLPAIEQNTEVILGFRSDREGLYEIRLGKRTRLDASTQLYLKDEIAGKTIDLKKISSYTFFHDPENMENRFKLYFNPSDDIINNTSPDSWFTVYSHGNWVYIIKNTNRELSGVITFFNMLGQPVYQAGIKPATETSFQVDLPSGYYIVSIASDLHVANTKILLGKP